jgi:hypothetical protein
MPPLSTSESYRPLSLLALAGFGLAVVYGLVVLLGGAVAIYNRVPWLLPIWTFLVPILAVVLSWVARSRIRDSEETLSGVAFTTWGMGLGVLVGLVYIAYYGGTYLAVRQQASACAGMFIDRIKQGRVDKAFLLAVQPAGPGDDAPDLREKLEIQHNTSRGRSGGPYSMFRQTEFVRLIQAGGEQTRVEPVGVASWDYDQGGYWVRIKYRVYTPLAEFELSVETFGRDSKPGEPKGRQWRVIMEKGGTDITKESMTLTAEGSDMMKESASAWLFARTWESRLAGQDWDAAYLDSLPPDERERLGPAAQRNRLSMALAITGPAPLGLRDQAGEEYLKGRLAFQDGKVIRADDKTFWASPVLRADIIKDVKRVFQPHNPDKQPALFSLQAPKMPVYHQAGGQITFLFDASIGLLDPEKNIPRYSVEAQVAVSADESEARKAISGGLPAWRIQAVDLVSGRSAPTTAPGTAMSPPPPGSPPPR